ncbi:MAG: ribonuclease P protein component, partial [Aeromicrobium erythreum]
MLGAAHRMRDGQQFKQTVRDGRKAAQPALVVHLVPGNGTDGVTSVGFVVSKAVGPAVTRNRVKR